MNITKRIKLNGQIIENHTIETFNATETPNEFSVIFKINGMGYFYNNRHTPGLKHDYETMTGEAFLTKYFDLFMDKANEINPHRQASQKLDLLKLNCNKKLNEYVKDYLDAVQLGFGTKDLQAKNWLRLSEAQKSDVIQNANNLEFGLLLNGCQTLDIPSMDNFANSILQKSTLYQIASATIEKFEKSKKAEIQAVLDRTDLDDEQKSTAIEGISVEIG